MPRGHPGRPECSVDGCGMPHKAHGLCQNHYRQAKRRAKGLGRAYVRDRQKLCTRCETTQPVENFGARSNGHWHTYCSTCRPEVTAERRVASRYKISVERWHEMREGGCAVCGSRDRLCVDHDHSCCPGDTSCGECVRGVLCGPCNAAEGMLGSDPNRALALAAYILTNRNILSREAFQ